MQCVVGSRAVKEDLGKVYRPRFMCLGGEREKPMLHDVPYGGPFLVITKRLVLFRSGVCNGGVWGWYSLSLVSILSVEHLLPRYWRRGVFVLRTKN